MSRASHVAAFAAGCAVAAAVAARAAPRPEATRYRTLDTFAQALTYVSSQYVEPTDERKLLYAATRGMLQSLDNYSAFFSPADYKRLREDTEGEFPGVGLVLGPGGPDDDLPAALAWPIVDEVLPGSPAAAAGLAEDDRLVAIDGTSTVAAEFADKDERFWDARLRGDEGTRVVVDYLRPGAAAPATATLVRRQVKVPSVERDTFGPGIGYLAIRRFQEATATDVAAALTELTRAHADQVILLDLRTDSGGLVDQAIAVADLFLDGGTIVTIRGRGPDVETHDARRGGPATRPRLLVLVNAQTASAAEILAGALQDHHRATVLGMKTYGKGAIQTYFDLTDGSGLKLTTHRYLTPGGHEVEGRGISPDLEVPEFEPEIIVAGAGSGPGSATTGDQPPSNRDILGARGIEDHQLRIAYQTAQRWLGSK